MKLIFLCGLVLVVASSEVPIEDEESEMAILRADLEEAINSVKELRTMLTKLTRQTMLQQFAVEERTRTRGNSGIKLIRSRRRGLKNYDSPSHVGFGVYAIHDHSNYIRTIGMGEVSVAMKGVEFRTRHNDYKLVMPSTTSNEFQATENIQFPEVPPSVKGTVQEQIDELSLWFKAFKDQDKSERDYTKYFKPVFCYMEGAWTLDDKLREPFKSERHQIDASSWFDLQEKMKFSVLTGTKNAKENLAYLPTTISSVNETSGEAEYAQWNYRILCKPVDKDIPISSLIYTEDLSYRMKDSKSVERTLQTRAARFKLFDESMPYDYQLEDEVFYTVPGADNIPSDDLRQETFGEGDLYDISHRDSNVVLKSGFYHRQYKYAKKGAMGLSVNPRGFNDENCWVAQTTQSLIAPVCLEKCGRELQPNGRRPIICRQKCNRFTYAIPLEIVYLTPLSTWNPYNIIIHQDKNSSVRNGANGGSKPFNGADWNHYYLTPAEFFIKAGNRGSADTTKRGGVTVLDSQGNERKVVASGTRIKTDEIFGAGEVRLRYPIAPVADEGSSVWKELTALKDLVYEATGSGEKAEEAQPQDVWFQMSVTTQDPPGEHTHDVYVQYSLFRDKLMKNQYVDVTSDQDQGHTHELRIRFNTAEKRFHYTKCDSDWQCWDGHEKWMTLMSDNVDVDAILAENGN